MTEVNRLIKSELMLLSTEIAIEGYETANQVNGAINNRIEELELRIASYEYERDAKLDHMTDV